MCTKITVFKTVATKSNEIPHDLPRKTAKLNEAAKSILVASPN